MDVGDFFGLDSVEIKLDNKNVTNYLTRSAKRLCSR